MAIQFNYTNFAAMYAQFSNTVLYPPATLQLYWNDATTIINANPSWCSGLTVSQLGTALNLMTAHLTQLNTQAAAGQTTGLVQGATIDKVSVTLTPPPEVNQWQWWLNQTQYGQQLLARMQIWAAGGFYVGGYPTTFTLPR